MQLNAVLDDNHTHDLVADSFHVLEHLIEDIYKAAPFLKGEMDTGQAYITRVSDEEIQRLVQKIDALYQALAMKHPESGTIHWICRTWNLLIWQAIYITVGLAQSAQLVPSLKNFGLYIEGSEVKGYSFFDAPLFSSDGDELIQYAGNQIYQFIQILYRAFNEKQILKPKLADKLCADCVNAALLYHNGLVTKYSQEKVEDLSFKWLSACRLPILPSTIALPSINKMTQSKFGFNRQTCCQEFRVEKGVLCDSCPKRSMDKRIQCMIGNDVC